MRKFALVVGGIFGIGLLGACATTGSPEQVECRQPNRRVSVEMGGIKIKPAPKPKPGAKPGKPGRQSVMLKALVQGNSAFDPGSAVLKDDGKKELDKLVNTVAQGAGRDKRPTTVGSVVITGHTDSLEASKDDNTLSESRAKAVMQYLVSKGVNPKLIFWEGVGSRQPVPVTKFCD